MKHAVSRRYESISLCPDYTQVSIEAHLDPLLHPDFTSSPVAKDLWALMVEIYDTDLGHRFHNHPRLQPFFGLYPGVGFYDNCPCHTKPTEKNRHMVRP